MSYVSEKLRQKIIEQARNRCGYCLGEQRYVFAPLEIEHILPTALGGTDAEENLWLACRLCNSYKGRRHTELTASLKRKHRFSTRENKIGNVISKSKTGLKSLAKRRLEDQRFPLCK